MLPLLNISIFIIFCNIILCNQLPEINRNGKPGNYELPVTNRSIISIAKRDLFDEEFPFHQQFLNDVNKEVTQRSTFEINVGPIEKSVDNDGETNVYIEDSGKNVSDTFHDITGSSAIDDSYIGATESADLSKPNPLSETDLIRPLESNSTVAKGKYNFILKNDVVPSSDMRNTQVPPINFYIDNINAFHFNDTEAAVTETLTVHSADDETINENIAALLNINEIDIGNDFGFETMDTVDHDPGNNSYGNIEINKNVTFEENTQDNLHTSSTSKPEKQSINHDINRVGQNIQQLEDHPSYIDLKEQLTSTISSYDSTTFTTTLEDDAEIETQTLKTIISKNDTSKTKLSSTVASRNNEVYETTTAEIVKDFSENLNEATTITFDNEATTKPESSLDNELLLEKNIFKNVSESKNDTELFVDSAIEGKNVNLGFEHNVSQEQFTTRRYFENETTTVTNMFEDSENSKILISKIKSGNQDIHHELEDKDILKNVTKYQEEANTTTDIIDSDYDKINLGNMESINVTFRSEKTETTGQLATSANDLGNIGNESDIETSTINIELFNKDNLHDMSNESHTKQGFETSADAIDLLEMDTEIDENINNITSPEISKIESIITPTEEFDALDAIHGLKDVLESNLEDITSQVINLKKSSPTNNLNYQYASNNREELVINGIYSETSFSLGKNVLKWKKFKSYLIGVENGGILLLKYDVKSILIKCDFLETAVTPQEIELFQIWNTAANNMEMIIIVTFNNTINWYKIDGNDSLKLVWTKVLHENIRFIKFLNIEEHYLLCTVTNNEEDKSAINIYQFTLSKDFWLVQHINLDAKTDIVAFNFVQNTVYFSVPLFDKLVRIYQYHKNHFVHFKDILSENVKYIESFQIGHKPFLAVGGYNHTIYSFKNEDIYAETILDYTFGNVDYFLPIYLENYRSDLILLVQHEIDYDSHKTYHLEALIFDGIHFKVSPHPDCDLYGDITSGFDCLLDEELKVGLKGSTDLQIKNRNFILTPHHAIHSSLFEIKTELESFMNPTHYELNKFREWKQELLKRFYKNQGVLQRTKDNLEKVLKVNGDNVVTADWKVNKLETPVLYLPNKNTDWSDGYLAIDNVLFSKEDFDLHIPTLVTEFEKISIATSQEIPQLLQTTVLNDDNIKLGKSEDENEYKSSKVSSIKSRSISDEEIFEKSYNTLKLDDISIDNLIVESVNGMEASNFIYKTDDISVFGSVIFETPVFVGNLHVDFLNSQLFENSIVQIDKIYDGSELNFETVEVLNNTVISKSMNNYEFGAHTSDLFSDGEELIEKSVKLKKLVVDDNLIVENINGYDWNELIRGLSLKNIPMHFEERITVNGSVISKPDYSLAVDKINNIDFPNGFEISDSQTSSTIKGKKKFLDTFMVHQMDSKYGINNIKAEDVITLNTAQNISGVTNFQELQVVDSLNVGGSIHGPYLDTFLSNPTLEEVQTISSSVIFRKLDVIGNVTVKLINNKDLSPLLEDVVLKNEPNIVLSSIKTFNNLDVNNLEISSQIINGQSIDKIMTTDTRQTLNFHQLKGDFIFGDISLGGLYDSINVTDLYLNTVKLNGEQHVAGELEFENVEINDLNIENFGDFNPSKYLKINDEIRLKYVDVENLIVEELQITDSLNASGLVNDVNLTDFDNRRFSLKDDQDITGIYVVNDSNVTKSLNAETINGISVEMIFQIAERYQSSYKDFITSDELYIDQLIVFGDIETSLLNERNLKSISEDAIWINRGLQIVLGNISFLDTISTEHLFVTGNLNNYDCDDYFNDFVYKDEDDLEIRGLKVYTNGISVVNDLVPANINKIRFEDIFVKSNMQYLTDLEVFGDVSVNNIDIKGTLNNYDLYSFRNDYDFVNNTHFIYRDLVITEEIHINDLVVNSFNHKYVIDDFFTQIIRKNDNAIITNDKHFQNDVSFDESLNVIERINHFDLVNFLKNVLLIHAEGSYIVDEKIVFTDEIFVKTLKVRGNVLTNYIDSFSVKEWVEHSIDITKPQNVTGLKYFQHLTWEKDLVATFINNNEFSKVVTLHDNQNICYLNFNEIYIENDSNILGYVNGIHLKEEEANTLMIDGDQKVLSPLRFLNNVTVENDIKISGVINENLHFQNIFTLNTDQNISCTFKFENVEALNVYAEGTTSGIDMDQFQKNVILKNSNVEQRITGKWRIKNSYFNRNIGGNGILNDIDIRDLLDDLERNRLLKMSTEEDLLENFQSMCGDFQYVLEASRKQLYLFKHFVNVQSINTDKIESTHYFKFKNNGYLILNYNNCLSTLFKWNATKKQFEETYDFITGIVKNWLTIRKGHDVFLVNNAIENEVCEINFVSVWKTEVSYVKKLMIIKDEVVSLQNGDDGSFYILNENGVTQYVIKSENSTEKGDTWNLKNSEMDKLTFVPRSAGQGLSLSDGKRITKLLPAPKARMPHLEFDEPTLDIIPKSSAPESECPYLPQRGAGEVLAMSVGYENIRVLIAVSTVQQTTVRGQHDFIKIYEDIMEGRLFQTLPCFRPSSLSVLELGAGQTLLAFIENNTVIQIYMYKGIEGFKHLYEIKMAATSLTSVTLPIRGTNGYETNRNFLLVVNEFNVFVLEAEMYGDHIKMNDLNCTL